MNNQRHASTPEALDEFLDRQLRTFRRCMKDASQKAAKDIEHIHQLRVSSRRLLEVIRIVTPLADPQICRWFQKNVRRVLRVAGKARDLDLLILAETSHEVRSNKTVVQRWVRQRKKLQKKIQRKQTSLCQRGLRRRSQQLLKSVRRQSSSKGSNQSPLNQSPLNQTWYRESLCEVAGPFVDSIQSASELESIHKLRIAGKKFRYTLELLGPLLNPGLSEKIAVEMKSLQEQLGLLQDHVVSRKAFDKISRRRSHRHDRDDLLRRLAQQDQQIAECAATFYDWQQSADSRRLVRDIRKLCGTSNGMSQTGAR